MHEMRILRKWERNNAIRTGGGPPLPKPSEVRIEATGAIAQVFDCYGHLMTGRIPFDSDRPDDENECDDLVSQTVMSSSSAVPATATSDVYNATSELLDLFNSSVDPTELDRPTELTQTGEIDLEVAKVDSKWPAAPSKPANVFSWPPPRPPRQYFGTSDQRRNKRMSNSTSQPPPTWNNQNEFWAERAQYMRQEQAQSAALHRKRIELLEKESAKRIQLTEVRITAATFQAQYWRKAVNATSTAQNVAGTPPPIDIVDDTGNVENVAASAIATVTSLAPIAKVAPLFWNYHPDEEHQNDQDEHELMEEFSLDDEDIAYEVVDDPNDVDYDPSNE